LYKRKKAAKILISTELENVANAMHCNMRPFILRCNGDSLTKFQVGQPVRCCLIAVFLLLIPYVTL